MIIQKGLGDGKRVFHSHGAEVLIIRRLCGVWAGRKLDVKSESGLQILVDIQSNAMPASNVLQRTGNGVGRPCLRVGAKPEIAAEVESAEIAEHAFDLAGQIVDRRVLLWLKGLHNGQ